METKNGVVKFENRLEVIEAARKYGLSYLLVRQHRDVKEFVYDMESRGLKRTVLPQYFDFVEFQDGRIVEILDYDPDDGDLVTNTVFMPRGQVHATPEYEGTSRKIDVKS